MVIPQPAPPTGPPVLARRPVLLALAAVLAAPTAGLIAGCGSDEPDPLVALAAAAREDAAVIDALVGRLGPGSPAATKLTPTADARRAHAQALSLALGEAEEPPPPTSSTPARPPGATDQAGAFAEVRGRLGNAQRQAAALVPGLPRQRAALVGSIAAGCAAHQAVLG